MPTPFAGIWTTTEVRNGNALHTIVIGIDNAGHLNGHWSVAYPITTPIVCTATFIDDLIFSDVSQVNVVKVVEHYTSFSTAPPNEPVSDGGGWPDVPMTLSLSSATACVATFPDGSIETFTKPAQPQMSRSRRSRVKIMRSAAVALDHGADYQGPVCINVNSSGGTCDHYDYEHTDNGTGPCMLCDCSSFIPNS